MDKNQFNLTIEPLFIQELNYQLSEIQLNQFYDFMNLLIRENEKYNLTRIVDPIEIIYKHFLDSCQILKFRDFSFSEKSFIDIGCGAGFPSIPLSILFPDSKFVLVDSVNKKLGFIEKVRGELILDNIMAIHSRAEDLARENKYIEFFDYSLSRAVSQISVVLEYSSQFLSIGGKVFVYKMADSENELNKSINSQHTLNVMFSDEISYCLNDSDRMRKIYCFIKKSSTPTKYPRKAGIPSKSPL